MSHACLLHEKPGFEPIRDRRWLLAAFEWRDATHLFHDPDRLIQGPVRLRLELSYVGDVKLTDWRIWVEGVPRQLVEMSKASGPARSVAGLFSETRANLAEATGALLQLPLSLKAFIVENGSFNSDDPAAEGYRCAHIDGCLETNIGAHVDAISSHQLIEMVQAQELVYLARMI